MNMPLSDIPNRIYCNNPKYWDRQAWAIGIDPEQMPQNVASGQGLHCHSFSTILDTSTGSKIAFFFFKLEDKPNILGKYDKREIGL